MTAQHAAAGGVLGKVAERPESPGDDIVFTGTNLRSTAPVESPGLQAGGKDSAQPQAERHKEINDAGVPYRYWLRKYIPHVLS